MTYEEFLKIGLDAVPAGYDTSENSFIHQAVSAAAIMAHELFIRISLLEEQQWSDNWSGDFLDRQVYDRTGLTRRPATRAKGTVRIKLAASAYISPDDFKLEYGGYTFRPEYGLQVAAEDPVEIPVEAEIPGFIGIVPANSLRMVRPSNVQLTSITHKALTPGGDPESDTSLRTRYRSFYTDHPVTNNPAQFKAWAMEVPGVTQARIIRAAGDHEAGIVTVYVLGEKYRKPTTEILEAVRAHTQEQMGFDVKELRVLAPKEKVIKLNIRGQIIPGVTPELAVKSLQEAVDGYLAFYPDPNYIIHRLYKYEFVPIMQKAGVFERLVNIEEVGDSQAISWEFAEDEIPVVVINEVVTG